MEYIFGKSSSHGECLKTIGETHSDFSGNNIIEREYANAVITDTFDVIKKYQSKIDAEGMCYDWYEIANHYRYIDKYTPNIGKVEERFDDDIADTQNAVCDLSTEFEERISDIENALCELSEMEE